MFRLSARHPARLAVLLPALILASCGGSNLGAVITVPNWVVVADLNGDGLPDVAVVAAQIDETGLTQKPGLLGVELNNKSTPGVFGTGTNYQVAAAPPSGLAVGDLSGTGTMTWSPRTSMPARSRYSRRPHRLLVHTARPPPSPWAAAPTMWRLPT